MGGVQRVADEHLVAERPALVGDPREVPPHRAVRDERMAVERLGEDALAHRLRRLGLHPVEAGA
jgi:hypothetical protein